MNDAGNNNNGIPSKKTKKHRHRRRGGKSTIDIPADGYSLLCFDTETTNHGELLELSVFDINGKEVYHQYFKPSAKTWPTDIHHITPEMVADCKRFSHYRHEIGKLLNSTKYLIGCALSNDLHTLHRYGIELHGKHRILDIQHWHWLLNDSTGRAEKQQTGLSAIASHYGLSFGDSQAHSATADTRVTLECFNALARDFISRQNENNLTIPDMDETVNGINSLDILYGEYSKAYQRAMQEYRMMNSKGFINVVQREKGYSFKYTRFYPTDTDKIVLSVEVNDRVKADCDLRSHFAPIQLKGLTGIFDLHAEDFEYIRNYRNTIDLASFIEREKAKQLEIQAAEERARKAIAAKKSAQLKKTPGINSSATADNTKSNSPTPLKPENSEGFLNETKNKKKSRSSRINKKDNVKKNNQRAATKALRKASKGIGNS